MIRFFKILSVMLLLAPNCFAQTIPQKMQQGLVRFESGDLDGAFALFQSIIQENPQHGPAQLLLGQITLQRGELQQAEEHLKVATSSNPRRIQLAWQLLGKVQLLEKKYTEAQISLQHSLEVPGSESEELSETKWLLDSLKTDPDSGNRLKVVVGENLGRSEAYSALGMHLVRAGDSKGATPLFEIASQLNSRNPLARFFLQSKESQSNDAAVAQSISEATSSLKDGNSEAAELKAKQILEQRPKYIPAHLILIEVAETKHAVWDALAGYRTLLQWLPQIPSIQSRFAILTRDIEVYDVAECSVRKALEVQPQDGSLHYLLGSILAKEGKTDAAIEACKKAIQLGFNSADLYVTLGNLYYEKMMISDSIAALGKAIELDPGAAETIASFALSALTTADYQALRTLLEKQIEANPEDVNTLYSLGKIYSNEGKIDQAEEYFERLVKLKPDSSEVRYNLALICSRQGKQQEADQAMSEFRRLKLKEQEDWVRYSEAHKIRHEAAEFVKAGQYKQALERYEKLAEAGTATKEDLLAAAKASEADHNPSTAVSWYERVLKIAPYNRPAIEGLAGTSAYRNHAKLLTPTCK